MNGRESEGILFWFILLCFLYWEIPGLIYLLGTFIHILILSCRRIQYETVINISKDFTQEWTISRLWNQHSNVPFKKATLNLRGICYVTSSNSLNRKRCSCVYLSVTKLNIKKIHYTHPSFIFRLKYPQKSGPCLRVMKLMIDVCLFSK
jgi:hypothetical protein